MARMNDLRQALLDAFARDPRIGSPNISVTFLEDTVALTGEVSSLRAKEKAEHLTRQIVPGLGVDNSLVITGNRLDDDQTLGEKAQQALFEAGFDLGVRVLNGLASLQGQVESLAKRDEAHRIVARIPGLREVRDDEAVVMDQEAIEIFPEKQQVGKLELPVEGTQLIVDRDDATITNEVEEALATEMSTPRADEIHVQVQNGVVTLDGWVKTVEEAAQARLLAQRVSGVKSVRNRVITLDGATGGDEALNQEIRRAFGAKGDPISPVDIQSAVVKQVAYLWGEVDTPEQRIGAERLAQAIPGITKVINHVQVVTRRSRPARGPRGGE